MNDDNQLVDIARALGSRVSVTVEPCESQIGSGARPVDILPSAAIVVWPARRGRGDGRLLTSVQDAFLALPIPIIGRIGEGTYIFDMRCLEDVALFCANFETRAPIP